MPVRSAPCWRAKAECRRRRAAATTSAAGDSPFGWPNGSCRAQCFAAMFSCCGDRERIQPQAHATRESRPPPSAVAASRTDCHGDHGRIEPRRLREHRREQTARDNREPHAERRTREHDAKLMNDDRPPEIRIAAARARRTPNSGIRSGDRAGGHAGDRRSRRAAARPSASPSINVVRKVCGASDVCEKRLDRLDAIQREQRVHARHRRAQRAAPAPPGSPDVLSTRGPWETRRWPSGSTRHTPSLGRLQQIDVADVV